MNGCAPSGTVQWQITGRASRAGTCVAPARTGGARACTLVQVDLAVVACHCHWVAMCKENWRAMEYGGSQKSGLPCCVLCVARQSEHCTAAWHRTGLAGLTQATQPSVFSRCACESTLESTTGPLSQKHIRTDTRSRDQHYVSNALGSVSGRWLIPYR